jgi:DedD protein
MSEGQDTEITLGTGRLLGLFFGLVIVCALFFGLGFSMGRNSVKSTLTMEEAPASTMPAQTNAGQKLSPVTPEKPAVSSDPEAAAPSATEAQAGSAPVVTSSPSPASAGTTLSPEIGKNSSITPTAGAYTVQVAAVSKQEDADALLSALKKKSYPVFIASNNSDKLFHVQIGPFSDIKDAEAMKTKLTGDGYNPILKR